MRNDLEPPVVGHHPAIARIRQSLLDAGANSVFGTMAALPSLLGLGRDDAQPLAAVGR